MLLYHYIDDNNAFMYVLRNKSRDKSRKGRKCITLLNYVHGANLYLLLAENSVFKVTTLHLGNAHAWPQNTSRVRGG